MNKNEVEEYDYVKNPKHYQLWDNFDTWEPYVGLLTKEEFIGFCKGNILKYQLRLGRKPGQPVQRDIDKIKVYTEKLNELLKSSVKSEE